MLHSAPSLFRVTHFTSLISASVSDITNRGALRRPLYSWSAAHQSSHVRPLFILLIICDDLPVLVGVQSVEEIVTAVLPWRVRELEDRQEWKIKAVFTQRTAIRQRAFNAYNLFLFTVADSDSVHMENCSLQLHGWKPLLSCDDRTNNAFQNVFKLKNSLKENQRPQLHVQETLLKNYFIFFLFSVEKLCGGNTRLGLSISLWIAKSPP